MKVLTALAIVLLLISCTTKTTNYDEENRLRERVAFLEKKVDSLLNEIYKKPKTATIQKKGKKGSKDASIPLKGYATSSPIVSEPIQEKENIVPQVQTKRTASYRTTAPSQSNYSGQCMAITKKGTRCSRAARSNGYCWQHGG